MISQNTNLFELIPYIYYGYWIYVVKIYIVKVEISIYNSIQLRKKIEILVNGLDL